MSDVIARELRPKQSRVYTLFEIASLALAMTIVSCASNTIFPELTTQVASPLTVAIDSANARAYLNNSNSLVEYQSQEGSLQVLDITNPASPTLLKTQATSSFSAEMFFDAPLKRLLVANRYSATQQTTSDALLNINVDESSADFLNVTTIAAAKDPFGIACCDANNHLLVTSADNKLQYFDVTSADLSPTTLDLTLSFADGSTLTGSQASFVAISGAQAFVSRSNGGVIVLNLDELGVAGANPIDYLITDITSPRGLAVAGGKLYVATRELVSNKLVDQLLVLDISTLTPNADATVAKKDKDDDKLLVVSVEVGTNPQTVIAGTSTVFVSNQGSDSVSLVSLADNSKVDVAVGDEPFGLALYSPAGVDTHLFVCNVKADTLSVIDLSDNTVVKTYP